MNLKINTGKWTLMKILWFLRDIFLSRLAIPFISISGIIEVMELSDDTAKMPLLAQHNFDSDSRHISSCPRAWGGTSEWDYQSYDDTTLPMVQHIYEQKIAGSHPLSSNKQSRFVAIHICFIATKCVNMQLCWLEICQHCRYWCPGAKAPGHQYPQSCAISH